MMDMLREYMLLVIKHVLAMAIAASMACSLLICCATAEDADHEIMADQTDTKVYLLPENATEQGIPVETQYATFFFPVDYAGMLQLMLIETEDGTMLIASTANDDVEMELYFLSLSQFEMDGICIGRLQDEELGELSIYMMMAELDVEGMIEEEMNRLYELQESVNVILEQLMADPRYVAAE